MHVHRSCSIFDSFRVVVFLFIVENLCFIKTCIFQLVSHCQVVKMYPREEGDAGDEINQMKKNPSKTNI